MTSLLSFFPLHFFALPVHVVSTWLDGDPVEVMADIDEEEEFTAMEDEDAY